jgi:hypothetical protein
MRQTDGLYDWRNKIIDGKKKKNTSRT